MKRYALAICLACKALFAAPVGDASAPNVIQEGIFSSCNSRLNVRIGYEGDFVTDGRMNQKGPGRGRVDNYRQYTNSATLTCNFLNRMDLYGAVGSSETRAEWRFINENVNRIEMETQAHLLWRAGIRTILYEWYKVSLGLGGSYSACETHPKKLVSNGVEVAPDGAQVQWWEYQVNLDLSYRISLFTPYIGVKYSDAQAQLTHFPVSISQSGTSNDFKNRVPVGLYLGCVLSNRKIFMLTLEGRLIDEEAVTLSGDFKF